MEKEKCILKTMRDGNFIEEKLKQRNKKKYCQEVKNVRQIRKEYMEKEGRKNGEEVENLKIIVKK